MHGTRICTLEGCGKKHKARGMCSEHYEAWKYRVPASERPRPSVDERFESKIRKGGPDECWEWTATRARGGYGSFSIESKTKYVASRFALIRAVGEPPHASARACHTCDNPPCCNPRHLYWGTAQDNTNDAKQRGRIPRGQNHSNTHLTDADVLDIRRRCASGQRQRDVAADYVISPSTVAMIVTGRTWRHLLDTTK